MYSIFFNKFLNLILKAQSFFDSRNANSIKQRFSFFVLIVLFVFALGQFAH